MNLSNERKQRNEFQSILYDLAQSQDYLMTSAKCWEMCKRLEKLYSPNSEGKQFRHFYSDIFSVLTQIKQDPSKGSIDILGQNLKIIRKKYTPKNKDAEGELIDISDNIRKLYDHVSLDIARITYSDAADEKISGETVLNDLGAKINEMQDKTEKINKKADKIELKLNKSQKEYISILGIFSAVVLTLNGGFDFMVSVFNNISEASIYRIAFIALLVGIIIINILFGLFYFINRLNDKDKKLAPLIFSNIILLILVIMVFVSWNFGIVETRNERIQASSVCHFIITHML